MKNKVGLALSIGAVVAGGVLIYKKHSEPGFWKGFGAGFLIFSLSSAMLAAGSGK